MTLKNLAKFHDFKADLNILMALFLIGIII